MRESLNFNAVCNSIVPISRFNKGEANKIFEEVKDTGFKIVFKNNTPTCVLVDPETYGKMLETIEDYNLLMEVEKRMENVKNEELISQDIVMKKFNISEEDLENIDVEIE